MPPRRADVPADQVVESDVVTSAAGREYLQGRYKDIWAYYETSSKKKKRWYQWLQILAGVSGVAIPAVVNIDLPISTTTATVLGLVVAVIAALESVTHNREQWRNYRSTQQMMERERTLYEYGAGEYESMDAVEALRHFVVTIENAVARERASTLSVMTFEGSDVQSGRSSSTDKGDLPDEYVTPSSKRRKPSVAQ